MQRTLWLCATIGALLLSVVSNTFAQGVPTAKAVRTLVTGRVVEEGSGKPIGGVVLTLKNSNQTTTTRADGTFTLTNVLAGQDLLQISSTKIFSKEEPIEIQAGKSNELGDIAVTLAQMSEDMQYVGVIDAIDLVEGEGTGQDVSTMVIFSNDVYLQNSGYQFSQFRHRTRGYDSRFEERYINGVSFNEQVRGVFNYSSIGALNDLTRNGNSINYLGSSRFSFGDLAGSENINMRPGNYTKGGKLTLSGANRNYYSRAILSYNTGLMDNGWAVTAALGGRYAHEGAIKGVFYKNIAYAFGAEHTWNNGTQRLSLITFGSPVERGQQGSSVEEAVKLVNDNTYNPNWGYQNGKKRNARVVKSWDPTLILSYVWKPDELTEWTTGAAYHYNRYGRSSLNWYDGADPRPDYYRYLPSYFNNSPETQEYYNYLWQAGKISQINWDNLIEVNHRSRLNGDGNAVYMVEERRSDLSEFSFNSTLNKQLSRSTHLTAGVGYKYSQSRQYKTVDDLLGALYVLDNDKFAERDFIGDRTTIQNDLRRPGRRVYEGDIFGYHYHYNMHHANIWLQQEHRLRHWDFYYGAKLAYNFVQRDGKMQNGRYPNNSYGKGIPHHFITFEAKAGATYKINGRHFLTGNVSYQSKPPLVRDMYVSPDITDDTAKGLTPLQVAHTDINYIFSTSKVKGRLSYFYTGFWNDMKKVSYYHDQERSFVHHTLYGMDKVHHGAEVGIEYRPDNSWTFDLIGTIAQYYYSNNPMGVMTSSNGKIKGVEERVYMKNLYLGGVPQMIGTFGIGYFYNYWFFNLNINGFGNNHIDPAPIRRLASNYTSVAPVGAANHKSEQYEAFQQITTQERFKPGATLDLSVGKIIYLPGRQQINFNLTVNNLLDNRDVRVGGFEQGRINLEYPERFGNKHYYMQGINFFLNASYRF